MKRIRCFAK